MAGGRLSQVKRPECTLKGSALSTSAQIKRIFVIRKGNGYKEYQGMLLAWMHADVPS